MFHISIERSLTPLGEADMIRNIGLEEILVALVMRVNGLTRIDVVENLVRVKGLPETHLLVVTIRIGDMILLQRTTRGVSSVIGKVTV